MQCKISPKRFLYNCQQVGLERLTASHETNMDILYTSLWWIYKYTINAINAKQDGLSLESSWVMEAFEKFSIKHNWTAPNFDDSPITTVCKP